jgi:hypothetical protein
VLTQRDAFYLIMSLGQHADSQLKHR